jgi:DNA-binding CsgD family transcriptional regulator
MHSLRRRPARVSDVPQALELLARGGDGYGPSSPPAHVALISRLIQERALKVPLLEGRSTEPSERPARLVGMAMTGFVELAQIEAWVKEPPAQLVDHVLEREEAREPLLLRPDRVAAANAGEGMGLVFLGFRLAAPLDAASANTSIAAMFESFRLFHAGYYCPLAAHPPGDTARGAQSLVGLLFRPAGDGRSFWLFETAALSAAPYHPFIVLRARAAPKLGFSPSEKETLFHALLGYSDAEIAHELHISLETVKKRWRTVFERVADRSEPEIFPHAEVSEAKRGPEKRGMLLAYLDTHLEELRPYKPGENS